LEQRHEYDKIIINTMASFVLVWKHGKKRTYVGTKVRRQHRLFVCRGLESGKKTKTIPVFYRML
jgi:hypothetical protein